MSSRGLEKAAYIFTLMQQLRIELLRNRNDKQDILLAQMLSDGKEAMKDKFSEISLMKKEKKT